MRDHPLQAGVNTDERRFRPPEVLKAVVRANQNKAGIYGAVTRGGPLAVGQSIHWHGGNERA